MSKLAILPRTDAERRVFIRLTGAILEDTSPVFMGQIRFRINVGESPGWSEDGALIGEIEITPPAPTGTWPESESYPIFLALVLADNAGYRLHWRLPPCRFSPNGMPQSGFWPALPTLTKPNDSLTDHDRAREAALSEMDRRWESVQKTGDRAVETLAEVCGYARQVVYWLGVHSKSGPTPADIVTRLQSLQGVQAEAREALQKHERAFGFLKDATGKLLEGHAPPPPSGEYPYWSFDPDPATVPPLAVSPLAEKDPLDSEAFG